MLHKEWPKADWDGTMKCALLGPSYVYSDNHTDFSDVQAYEVSGTGYTAGGATLTGKTETWDATARKMVRDCDDVTWGTSTIDNARFACFYESGGTVVMTADFDEDISTENGLFTVQISVAGLMEYYA